MKRFVSILLVITVLFNVAGLGFLSIQASALAPIVIAILEVAKYAIVGTAAGILAEATTEGVVGIQHVVEDEETNYFLQHSTEDITNGNMIVANIDSNNYVTFDVSSDCSLECVEYAERLSNSLNSLSPELRWVDPDGHNARINASAYADIKSQVTNDYLEYVSEKALGNAVANELGFSLGQNYQYDWITGGQPAILPSVVEYSESVLDGYKFGTPMLLTRDDGRFNNGDISSFSGASLGWKTGNQNDGYKYSFNMPACYGYGSYIIYNGKLYCAGSTTSSSLITSNAALQSGVFDVWNIQRGFYVSSDGETLAEAGCTSVAGLQGGFFYMTEPNMSVNPSNSSAYSDDMLQADVGGGTLSIPKTYLEQIVGNSISSGLTSADPTITLDSNGNIASVDNIDISTLENLLQQLSENQLEFDDIEGYLQTITQLLSTGNASTNQINNILANVRTGVANTKAAIDALKTVLSGVRELDAAQVDKLTNIDEQTAAIAEALTLAQEAELEREETEFSYLDINHVGLTEANEFVSRFTIVNQCSELLGNVLDVDKYNSHAPNFNFYYDSDGDEVQEVYTAFDLSFLDSPLTNSHLADKSRFANSMTIREFLQQLIIFICYVAFAIKMLKKLPGLLGSAESEVSDFVTIDKI